MAIIFLILPATIVLSSLAVLAFVWATNKGQFDDLQTPPLRILHDLEAPMQDNAGPRPSRSSAEDAQARSRSH